MQLRDWEIAVSTDPEAEPRDGVHGRNASVECTFGRAFAGVWYDRDYVATATAEELRQTTVHELIHVHLHRARETLIQLLDTHPKRVAAAMLGAFDLQCEYAVDALADVLAAGMPLPPAGRPADAEERPLWCDRSELALQMRFSG